MHLTYKYYPFIYANARFLQSSFTFYRVLTVYQKSSSPRDPISLEKDIKGLKRKKRIKEEKSLKLKTLCNVHAKLCNI